MLRSSMTAPWPAWGVAVWLAAASWAAAQGPSLADLPVMDEIAALSEGPRVSLRWSLPDQVFPAGGFVLTRIAPDGSRTEVRVASPLPASEAPVDAETYEALEQLYDPAVVAADDGEAFSLGLLRAIFALEAAADPDVARALGILVDHDGVALGERWRYEVRTGDGQRVGAAEITVGSSPPLDAPGGLRAQPAADGIALRWTAADEDTLVFGYRVEALGPDGAFRPLNEGWITPPTPDEDEQDPLWFVDGTPRLIGTTATYRLVGRDLFGRETPPSAPVTVAIADPNALPQAIIVDAESGDRTITLRWAVDPDPRMAAMAVLRATSPDATPQLASPLFTPDVLEWTDEGLRGGVDYYYAIAAFDRDGLASVGPMWAQRAINPHPPGAPSALSVEPRTDGLDLRWSAPPEDDVGRYQVFGGRPGTPLEGMALLAETRDTALTVPIPENTLSDVAFRVRAVNTSDVTGAASEEAAGRPLDATPPSPPLWLAVEGRERAVSLAWLRDLDPDVDHLRLWRATGAAGDEGLAPIAFVVIADRLDPGVTSYLDLDVVPGVVMTYRLEAVDASGNVSEPSEVRTASAWDLSAPAAPAGLQAELSEDGVRLAWEAAAVAGWIVERWWQGAWVEVSDLLEAPTFLDARGAAGGRYRVTAVSGTGQLGERAEVEVPEEE